MTDVQTNDPFWQLSGNQSRTCPKPAIPIGGVAIDQVNNDSVCKIARRVIGAGLSATGIGIAGKIPGTTEGLANEISDLCGCFGSAGLEIP